MNGPNKELMAAYGTEDAHLLKQAGIVDSFLGSLFTNSPRLTAGYFAHQRTKRDMKVLEQEQEEAALVNRALAHAELERLQAASAAARYTRAPVMVAPWMPHTSVQGGKMKADDIGYPEMPPGLDAGMVRLASVAGKTMANKEASIQKRAVGFVGQVGLGATAVGGLALAGKGLSKANKFMNTEAHTANFNQGGYQVPPSVNQHGYTSF